MRTTTLSQCYRCPTACAACGGVRLSFVLWAGRLVISLKSCELNGPEFLCPQKSVLRHYSREALGTDARAVGLFMHTHRLRGSSRNPLKGGGR